MHAALLKDWGATGNAVDGLLEAVVLAESGQPHPAAVLYDSMARGQRGPSTSKFSATRAWYWTHEAGAAASAGDTATLRRLEDSVRVSGALATERYERLHHYVRGLRLALEHKPSEAAAAFRQALWVRQSTHAWRHADPQFDQRRAVIDARIAVLTSSVAPTFQRSMPR